jgi:putative membrane protein
MWYDHGITGYGWVLMTVSMLVFWALLIAALVVLVRTLGRRNQNGANPGLTQSGGPSAAERLLAERFARGEIDEDEYQRRLTVLRQAPTSDSRS